jgi:hypothetical protein
MLCIVVCAKVAVIAVWPQDILAVGVEVNVESDSASVSELVDLGDHSFVLWGVPSSLAFVGL